MLICCWQQNPRSRNREHRRRRGHFRRLPSRPGRARLALYAVAIGRFRQAIGGARYHSRVQYTFQDNPYIIVAQAAENEGVVAGRLYMEVLQQMVSELDIGTSGRGPILWMPREKLLRTPTAGC